MNDINYCNAHSFSQNNERSIDKMMNCDIFFRTRCNQTCSIEEKKKDLNDHLLWKVRNFKQSSDEHFHYLYILIAFNDDL